MKTIIRRPLIMWATLTLGWMACSCATRYVAPPATPGVAPSAPYTNRATAATAALLKWPVRNGDFSCSQGWGRPAEWNPANESGKHLFKMDPQAAPGFTPNSAAVIESVEPGRAYYFQSVSLMKGSYRLNVEVAGTNGSRVLIEFVSGKIKVNREVVPSETWQPVTLEMQSEGGDATLYLFSTAGGTVKFRNVQIAIKQLESSPVPFENGAFLGGLALPIDPTPAEQYAAYEFQRYVFKLTGKVPGLEGRDKVYDGIIVSIGRTGRSELRKKLKGRAADSYLVASQGNRVFLAGNSDAGTLYAIYDVLKQQGCRWILPGDTGEVVPQRKSLGKINDKVEVPDYATRGFFVLAQDFFPGGGWIFVNMDDYFDWALKNRMNAIWGGGQSWDFGAYRGHGWIQRTGHSFNASIAPYEEYFKDHPDWYPLVRGERMPVSDVGPKLPNQLCVSNPGLREYTVKLVLDYFKKNPTSKAFPMNPMDGPNYWCECAECKKLDPPGIDWSQNGKGNLPVADRLINYANYVADRLAEVYPDKLIEVYAYNPRMPPVKEKVHPNILIKFAFSSGRPVNVGIMDGNNPEAKLERQYLDGWKAAGVKHLAYYNYADWEHPDASLFWFFSITDMLKNLKVRYACSGLMGETETQIQADPMWYAVMARTLWNVETDYREVIRDACDTFYGPAANDLYEFNLLMDKTVRTGKADDQQNRHLELSYDALVRGRAMLEGAAAKVQADPTLTRRVALARFGFANLMYVRALYEERKTAAWATLARDGFDTANALRNQYNLMVKLPSVQLLKDFYYPVIVDEKSAPVVELPVLWDFKTDPSSVGMQEEWFQKPLDSSWKKIRTDKAWTEQGYATYHGIAWYGVEFTLPADHKKASPLVLYFGAVDGYADIFLDGRKIGEQKTDVGLMWDKPFTVPLPLDLEPGSRHQLAVMIRKDHSAAGIWKPVKIWEMKK